MKTTEDTEHTEKTEASPSVCSVSSVVSAPTGGTAARCPVCGRLKKSPDPARPCKHCKGAAPAAALFSLRAELNGAPVVLVLDAAEVARLKAAVGGGDEQDLNAKELAARLGVSRRTISNYMAEGLIPFRKIGYCVRFRLAAVREALARFEQHNKPKTAS